jgi:hypothetical protein
MKIDRVLLLVKYLLFDQMVVDEHANNADFEQTHNRTEASAKRMLHDGEQVLANQDMPQRLDHGRLTYVLIPV